MCLKVALCFLCAGPPLEVLRMLSACLNWHFSSGRFWVAVPCPLYIFLVLLSLSAVRSLFFSVVTSSL